jgi:hypothetical protein
VESKSNTLSILTLSFPLLVDRELMNKKEASTLLFSTDLIGFPQFVAKFSTETPL